MVGGRTVSFIGDWEREMVRGSKGCGGAHTVCSENELLELRKQCVVLLFDCPHDRYAVTCPLRQVRTLDVVAQVNWLKTRGEEELRRVLACHAACR